MGRQLWLSASIACALPSAFFNSPPQPSPRSTGARESFFGRALAQVVVAVVLVIVLGAWAAAAERPTDAQLAKQYESLQRRTYYRHAAAIFEAVGRFNKTDESQLDEATRFVRAYYEGRWGEVRKTLAEIPPETAAGIYDKILGDLAGRNVPILTLDDCLGLTDACPGVLTTDRIRKLGLLFRVAVPKEQKLWLEQALKKGSAKLGADAKRKLVTGRVLIHAEFPNLARRYLPPLAEATQLEDEEARDEIVKFLASQDELDELEQAKVGRLWAKHVQVLTDAGADAGKSQTAADGLAELLGRAPMSSVEPWLQRLVRENPDSALRLAASLGRLSQAKLHDQNIEVRTNNLRAQKCLLKCVSEASRLKGTTWNPMALAMADWWIREAEHTFKDGIEAATSPGKNRPPHVAPTELLENLPDGAWAEALPASFRERLDLCVSKAVLVSDRYEEAVNLIVGLAKRNSDAGVALAEEYLKVWASRHDPHVPESVRKLHNLPGDARIMVTPIMMERNIDSLAKMMDVFRAQGIPPSNGQLVVDAFDICYSQAEVYRTRDIERVFGKVEEMDEGLFQHALQKMTQGLATRWRNVNVQEESGTRRDERQTLGMVREGYQAAVAMLDRRAKKHPEAWRFLVMAGSLLSDRGDFEYFQQLVADTATQRLAAFKEQNSAAHTYFQKAAAAYARQVPKLDRASYAIEPYLAWFHSLLGVGAHGNLNLSKPLDRAALDEIREAIRALPPAAAQAHLDRFAKHINARLTDAAQPLHEDLKYKYLASSLVITKDSPFSFQAQDKVTYYDELLSEIRLETRVDGPNVIHRDHEFGILLTVQHTEAMGRMADFGKYLTNDTPPTGNPPGGGKKQARPASPLLTVKKMINVQGRRDELERNITEALTLFYDIRSVTFSPRDVKPRATEKPGWQETVLAYVHVKAKDASVDKIPRIQMNLEFLDLTGPVAILAESAETLLKLTDQPTPPRPYQRLEITPTLDARNLTNSGEILLEVTSSACGLVPQLDELLDLAKLRKMFPVMRIDEHEGTSVRQLESWGDTVHAVSERRWTLALDGSAVEKAGHPVEFQLPPTKSAEATVHYQAYRDMDLVELDQPTTRIGSEAASDEPAVPLRTVDVRHVAAAEAGGVVLVLILLYVLVRAARRRRARPLRARDVFRLPEGIDGFSVVRLLRALLASDLVRLSEPQRAELQTEIERLQAACFRGQGSSMSEADLRGVAQKWLRVSC
jgi:hypothetical protein